MRCCSLRALSVGLLTFALALAAPLTSAAPPQVLKVEPPNWWPGHSLDPVRVLIRGRDLVGARVAAVGAGLRTGATRVNAAGTYAFVDVHIERAAHPGPRQLRVTTADGSVEAPFELSRPLPDAGRFQGFSSDDVLYLLMPDRFANGNRANDDPAESAGLLDRSKARYYHGGDFAGLRARLPYLKDLGVTTLWLNPIYDNVDHINQKEKYDGAAITDYHGYGAVDFYGVEERFGTLDEFRELVDAAHALGLKIVQDQVANHTGPYHPWVEDTPTPTWYNGTAARHLNNNWQTWTLADPYAAPETRRATLQGWFIDLLPDLNQDDPETRRYLIQNTLWWIGMTGLDGIRQDTLPYVGRDFWRDWSAAVRRQYPRFQLVGEMWDGDPALVAFFQGGRAQADGIDSGIGALFDFPLFYPLRRAFAEGKPVREVAQMLARDRLYRDPAQLVTFLGLHDTDRFANQPGVDAAGTHLAWTFLLTTRGIPLIYYGDEIGLPGGNDPDNRRDFPGGWADDPRNAFEASGRTAEEQALFQHIQALLRARSALPALRRGQLVHLGGGEQDYCYARRLPGTGQEVVVVALNNAKQPAQVECAAGDLPAGAWRARVGALAAPAEVSAGVLRVSLPARAGVVLVPER